MWEENFSVMEKPKPKKTGIGYKVLYLKDGKLYPPMMETPNGEETPVGVWLDARTNKRITLICSLRILSGHRLNMPMKVMIRYLIGI